MNRLTRDEARRASNIISVALSRFGPPSAPTTFKGIAANQPSRAKKK
jgi:hypothetical protein